MSTVGVCRIASISLIVAFMCFVIVFSQYNFEVNNKYPTSDKYLMLYIFPILIGVSLSLLLPAYVLCVVIAPRPVPDQYTLTTKDIAKFMVPPNYQGEYRRMSELTQEYMSKRPGLVVGERDFRHGGLRICEICSIIKPDRSHHCTMCNRCIIRMDHHCHWVDNCIHEGNHKYFIQLITMGLITASLILIVTLINISHGCTVVPLTTDPLYCSCILLYMGAGLSGITCLSLVFLTLDHCINLFRGQTSYERIYERAEYNRGWSRNFYHIMGVNVWEWVCPIRATKLSEEEAPLITTVEDPSTPNWMDSTEDGRSNDYFPEETLSFSKRDVKSPRVRNPSSITETEDKELGNIQVMVK